jgi:uncharacterized protein (TIGR02246 family)
MCSAITAAAEDADPNQANLDALAANAASFVEAYNKGDHGALAKLFLPEGEIVLANGDLIAGREEIAEFYQEVFSGDPKPKAALEAGSVRFPTPGIAIEDGTLHVTTPSGEVTSHYYTAVQVKQENGSWLTASIRDEIEDHAPASEKLIALEWLAGDWLIEVDGTRTFLAFEWSDDGPYLDGRALTETAGRQSTASTYRIGWNNERRNFVSWGFDAEGGYTKSEWTRTDDGFLLRTSGVTADGEVNQSTQTINPDDNLQGFTWASRDQTIGDEVQPDRTVRVVKRPPELDVPEDAPDSEETPDSGDTPQEDASEGEADSE